ncbi:MAG: hypothetical protein FWD56_05915 [Bacteroidales bacterium]|nr:hypothetical protein [Bacteroidales bacterium]
MRSLFLTCFISLFPFASFSQNQADYDLFMHAAKDNSVLFRGEFPMRHGNWVPRDGSTFYAFSLKYEKGEILFNGRLYKDIEMNLNAARDELYVMDPKGSLSVVHKDLVESFSMGQLHFIHQKQDDGVLQSGFYQILFSDKYKLYKKIRKVYYEKPGDGGRLQRGFTLSEIFYVKKNDQWYRIGSQADIKRLFAEQKKAIDHLSKTRNLNFRNNKERFLVEILTYMNQL